MNGDFSRSTFTAGNHYSGVRMQQGSVQIDADWNEQADIIRHQIVTPLGDVLGSFAAAGSFDSPAQAGFALALAEPVQTGGGKTTPPDMIIGAGRAYAEGVLCENDAACRYAKQPDYPGAAAQLAALLDAGCTRFIVYLDVWDRHVTALEAPAMADSALDGIDTTTRMRTIWQVKLLPLNSPLPGADTSPAVLPEWQALLDGERRRGRLSAQQAPGTLLRDNQLYRVEVHAVDDGSVAFKWSRENGAVCYGVSGKPERMPGAAAPDATSMDAAVTYRVTIAEQDPARLFLGLGDWVELVREGDVVDGTRRALYQVAGLQPDRGWIHVTGIDELPDETEGFTAGWLLRRWDQRREVDARGLARRAAGDSNPLHLENGVQVRFHDEGYRPGDFWLIPVRTQFGSAPGGVEWSADTDNLPLAQPPHGVEHRYALLGVLHQAVDGWQVGWQPPAVFMPLPSMSSKVMDLAERVAVVEAGVANLQTRVAVLEEKVEWVLSWLTAERAQLFYDYRATVALEVGDVVAIDPAHDNHVVHASSKNETLVVGVVTRVLTGQHGEPIYRVTMHGRTRCNVLGTVTPGALLIVSGGDGRAMQGGVFLRPGTVVGKALSGHRATQKKAEGVVDIMVTLA
jgi:hypothetical protein